MELKWKSSIDDYVAAFFNLGITLAEKGKIFDAVMILQPTSPFRTPDHINEAIRLLQKIVCHLVPSNQREEMIIFELMYDTYYL